MSIYRRAAKVDGTQAEIVSGLEAAHVEVWSIRLPCDLLVRFWCSKHQAHCWDVLECKPLTGKRAPKAKIRKEQVKQNEFLAATGTPVVTSFYEAWQALNARHHIGQ
ncbi:MAG: hypothetical protein JWO52_3479 [Gammaproteobacteria bacterium]|nr:hypothetical protein [Gammaproteobacteria bacterium]